MWKADTDKGCLWASHAAERNRRPGDRGRPKSGPVRRSGRMSSCGFSRRAREKAESLSDQGTRYPSSSRKRQGEVLGSREVGLLGVETERELAFYTSPPALLKLNRLSSFMRRLISSWCASSAAVGRGRCHEGGERGRAGKGNGDRGRALGGRGGNTGSLTTRIGGTHQGGVPAR